MLGASVDLEIDITAQEVREASDKRMMDAATKGFAVSQERVPQDRGTLQQSGFQPEQRGDDIVYGYTAPYAEVMEEGSEPFYPPLEPLLEWSKRVSGDVGLGYYVARHKIPKEGIDAQPYLEPSVEAVTDYLNSHGLEEYL
jgi:hypothetical protein